MSFLDFKIIDFIIDHEGTLEIYFFKEKFIKAIQIGGRQYIQYFKKHIGDAWISVNEDDQNVRYYIDQSQIDIDNYTV